MKPVADMRAIEFEQVGTDTPIYYFAYGMLTDPANVPNAKLVGRAVLPNFRFEMLQYANVVPDAGSKLFGTLWEIDDKLLRQLDRIEGYPSFYDRKTVPVAVDGKRYEAEVYVMTPHARDSLEGTTPDDSYIKQVANGYRNAGIPLSQMEDALESEPEDDHSSKVFYHGSMETLPIGTILRPNPEYEQQWQSTDFYNALEYNRPAGMMAHKDSVFMCDNPDDIDASGGGTEWLFTVEPLGPIQRHDLNWSSEISMLISDEDLTFDDPAVEEAAHNYWAGVPHPNEQVWEYLTPRARIVKVERY